MSGTGLVGGDTDVDTLIARYFPGRSKSIVYQLFESEIAVLLACILMEMRGDVAEGSHDDTTGDYYSAELTLDGDQQPIQLEWAPDRWDLRYSDDIVVRFTDEAQQHSEITYLKEESPVVGIPVRTSVVELEAADSATSTPTVRVQGWQG